MSAPVLRAAWLLAAGLLAGCVRPPPLPPLLDLAGLACGAPMAMTGAQPVLMDPTKPTVLDVDAANACAQIGGKRSLYAVFQLPDSTAPTLLTVRSLPRGETLLAPRLVLMDVAGRETRRLGFDAFTFRGDGLQAAVRAQPGDRYLVVASDPDPIGRREERIGVLFNAYPVGLHTTAYTGSEYRQGNVFTHNGTLSVTAQPVPR